MTEAFKSKPHKASQVQADLWTSSVFKLEIGKMHAAQTAVAHGSYNLHLCQWSSSICSLSEAALCNQIDTCCSGSEYDNYRARINEVNQYKLTAKAVQLKAVKDKRDIWFSFVKVVMQKQFVIQVTSGTDFQELKSALNLPWTIFRCKENSSTPEELIAKLWYYRKGLGDEYRYLARPIQNSIFPLRETLTQNYANTFYTNWDQSWRPLSLRD